MKYISLFILLFAIHQIGDAQDTSKVKSTEPIADFAEIEPEYPGGDEAMAKFIQTNIVYPERAREMGEQGVVYVQFVVNTDGSITDVVVIKSVSESLDAESIRVIKLMPNWSPGMQKGKAVRVRYTLPINFSIASGGKKKRKKS